MRCFLLLALLLPPTLSAQTPLRFTDRTLAAGIGWQQNEGSSPLMMGAGGAFFDADGDGREDILLVGGLSSPGFFRNLGGGRFADETVQRGLRLSPSIHGYAMCAAVGDVDADGDPDLFLGYDGPDHLLLNDGSGHFVPSPHRDLAVDAWTSDVAFGDYDGDGRLDLYVGHYIRFLNYPNHAPEPNRLYRNVGGGRFRDVSAATGTALAGTTLAVTWTDHDGDGDPDLMVANDFGMYVEANRLFRNDGPGSGGDDWRFTEVAAALGADPAIYCMGIARGDHDRDGDLDYYLSNLGRNVFLENRGPAGFVDVTTATGTAYAFDPTTSAPVLLATSWGVGFHDFDADGWLDLFVANGHIPAAPNILNGLATPAGLFHHDGPALTYTECAALAGAGDTGIGRGAAFADYDGDGDVDVLTVNVDGRPALLRNDTPPAGHHLVLRPRGTRSNTEGIGLSVTARAGGVTFLREANRTDSFESSSTNALIFGLGGARSIDEITARWPSGTAQVYRDLPVDLDIPLVEPLLTQGSGSSITPLVREGTTGRLEVLVDNHAARPVRGHYVLSVHAGGARVAASGALPIVVGASGTLALRFAVTPTPGSTGGFSRPLEIRLTIVDENGGVDQWAGATVLAP